MQLIEEVDRLQKSLDIPTDIAYSCETAMNFHITHIVSRWETFQAKIKESNNRVESIVELFPFKKFFENAPQPLFKKASFARNTQFLFI